MVQGPMQGQPELMARRLPERVRKKLRVMLLFKQSQGGSPIFEVQEDYKRCYGQEILPEAYGFINWVDMFESMDEFEVKSVKREKKIVRAKPLTHELTAAYLREIFPPERPIQNNVPMPERIETVNGMGETNEVAGGDDPTRDPVSGNKNVGSSSPDTTSQPLDLTVAEADNAAAGSSMNTDKTVPCGSGQSMSSVRTSQQRTSRAVNGPSTDRRMDGNENDDDDDVILVCEKKAKKRGRQKSDGAKPSVVDLFNAQGATDTASTVASLQTHDLKPPPDLLFLPQNEVPSVVVPGACQPGTSRTTASDSVNEQTEEDIKPRVNEMEVPTGEVKPVVKQEVKTEIKEENKQEIKVECKNEVKDEPKDEPESDPLAGSDSGSDNFQLEGDEEEILRYLDSPTPHDATEEAESADVLFQVEAVPDSGSLAVSTVGSNCEMLAHGPCHVNTILSHPISGNDSDGGESGGQKFGSPENVAVVSEEVEQEIQSSEETAAVSPTPLVPQMADVTADIPEPMDIGSQDESIETSTAMICEKLPSQAASGRQQKNVKSTTRRRSTPKHPVEQRATRASTQSGRASEPVPASPQKTRQNSNSRTVSIQPIDTESVESSAETSVQRGPSRTGNESKTPQKRRSPKVLPGTSAGSSSKRSKVVTPRKNSETLTSVDNKLERFSSSEDDNQLYRHRLFFNAVDRPHSSASVNKYLLSSRASEFYYGSKGSRNILEELLVMRENCQSQPSLMRFHPFYRPGSGRQCLEGPQRSTSFGSACSKEVDRMILSMSPESVQLLNLDAELNFELCGHLIGGKVTYISSYGHFEDYFIMRYGDKAKGSCYIPLECFGMSEFTQGKQESGIFPFFGESSVDIFEPSSKSDFEEFVNSNIYDPIDIFVANGIGYPGMECRPQELCLAQLAMALKILREGGMFVIKLEDTLSDMGVCFIRLLSLCFADIRIHKPVSAMPGERFVVCRRKKSTSVAKPFLEFARTCNDFIVGQRYEGYKKEIAQFYTMDSVKDFFTNNDEAFLVYVRNQNKLIGDREIDEWLSYIEYSKGIGVKTVEDRLKDCADARVTYWNQWQRVRPLDSIISIMDMHNSVAFEEDLKEVVENNLSDHVANVPVDADESPANIDVAGADTSQEPSDNPAEFWKQLVDKSADSVVILDKEKSVVSTTRRYTKPQGYVDQWMCLMSTGSKNRFVILACSNGVYKCNNKSWEIIDGLQLPKSTIIYGELFCSSKGQTLNIIDAAMLGAHDIRMKSFDERRRLCKDFASTVDAPFNENWRVIMTDAFPLENLSTELQAVCANKNKYSVQNSQNQFCASLEVEGSQNLVEFDAKEVLLLKTKLVTNVVGNVGTNGDETVDFKFIMRNRLFWEWNPRSNLQNTANEIAEELISKDCISIFSYMETNAKN